MAARLLLLVALSSSCCAPRIAAGLQMPGARAECSNDREAAFRSLRNRTASLWLFHVTHNAGTSVLNLLRDNLAESGSRNISELREGELEPGHFYYDNVFGENGLRSTPLGGQVPCASDRFVSVFPVRDPLPRILSGDGLFTTTADAHTDGCNTQNYGLRKLIGKGFGEPLTPRDVEFAKRRLDSFDIILDVSTLHDSVGSMCAALDLQRCVLAPPSGHMVATRQDVLDAVGPVVYNKWMERNAPEIEVYEYAQQLAADFVQRYPSPRPVVRQAHAAEESLGSDRWFCWSDA